MEKRLPRDYLSRKAVGTGVAFASCLFIAVMAVDYWYFQKPLGPSLDTRAADNELPFDLSSKNVLFETGSGALLKLTPKKPFPEKVEIRILLDHPYLVESIDSFSIQASHTRTVFIPVHSKNVPGRAVVSFKTSSKLSELKNLFKQQINIRVVHQIAFGYLSILLGWGYFIAWGSGCYPQMYKVWKAKSVVGFSFDYVALNLTGHMCYCVFNVALYYNSHIQKEYTQLHPRGELPVHLNDVVFSVHATFANVVYAVQCLTYERGDQRVSVPMCTLLGGLWTTITVTLFLGVMEKITWLRYLYYLSYIKIGVTPIKYIPQIYLHYVTKSTSGWSIHGVMCDVAGGVLSFLQMGVDAVNNDDWQGTLGNPGKVCLAGISMVVNAVFLTQHYILYPVRRWRTVPTEQSQLTNKPETKTQPLLVRKQEAVYKEFEL